MKISFILLSEKNKNKLIGVYLILDFMKFLKCFKIICKFWYFGIKIDPRIWLYQSGFEGIEFLNKYMYRRKHLNSGWARSKYDALN